MAASSIKVLGMMPAHAGSAIAEEVGGSILLNPITAGSKKDAVVEIASPSLAQPSDGKPWETRRRPPTSLLHDWKIEILCSVVVVVCLWAVVMVTLPYQGRPLSEWTYKLSINTIIAVLFAN